MIAIKKIILFALLGLCSLSYGGTIDPNIPDQKYLDFGSKFYCVVKLCGTYDDDSLFCASGVIIEKHFILTAAHVVKGYKTCYAKVEDKQFLLTDIIVHKDFGEEFGTGDIAIGYCEQGFPLEHYPPLYENDDEKGQVSSIAGWGLTGNFNTGIHKSDNKLRAGSNIVDGVDKDMLICSPSKYGSKDHTILEYMIGSGDSGGGLFIEGKLAGINSCVMAVGRSPMSKYNEESGHTRVSKFLGWINESKTKMVESSKRK
jgi:hypothetical protein